MNSQRGLRFARYADDCNIYVKSQRAGERVLHSITRWLAQKLRLTVNQQKSAVDLPWNRKFLGYTFTPQGKRTIAPTSKVKFKKRIRQLTKRNRGSSLNRVVSELRSYLLGWKGYFGQCQLPSEPRTLDSWLHRRLRCYLWKQWKTGRHRFSELQRRGVNAQLAAKAAGSRKGPWHLSRSKALQVAIPRASLIAQGLPLLYEPEPNV